MKELLLVLACLGLWAALWAIVYQLYQGGAAAKKKKWLLHAVGAAAGAAGSTIMLVLLVPKEPGQPLGWFAVIAAIAVTVFMAKLAKAMPEAVRTVRENDKSTDKLAQERAALAAMASRAKRQSVPVASFGSGDLAKHDRMDDLDEDDDIGWLDVDPVSVEFHYRDAFGNHSRRRVDVRRVSGDLFQGYCHHAGATRTFRSDRIQGDVVDVTTGEVFEPAKWFPRLRR